MQADIIALDGDIRTATLKRVEALLYGSFRSCNPTVTLGYASRAIGRVLRHMDIIHGRLTEREGYRILSTVGPMFPEYRDAMVQTIVTRNAL